jgi:hypothetical protein
MNSPCLLARLHLRGPGLAITAIWALSSCAPLTSAAHEYVTYTKTPWLHSRFTRIAGQFKKKDSAD